MLGQNCIIFNISDLKKIYKHANSDQTCTCTLLSTLSSSNSSTGCPSTYYPYLFLFFFFFLLFSVQWIYCCFTVKGNLERCSGLLLYFSRKTTYPSILAPHNSFQWNRRCHFIIYPSALNILQSELFLHLHNEVMVILVICHFIRYPVNFFLTGKSRRYFMVFIAASFLDSLHISIFLKHILLILFLLFTLFF